MQIDANPNHKYLLMDFCCSGTSLKSAHEFLCRDDLLGNYERFKTYSIFDLLGMNFSSNLTGLFMTMSWKPVSPVGKLPITALGDVFEQGDYRTCYELTCSKSAMKKRKLFVFNVMDLIAKNNKKRTGK